MVLTLLSAPPPNQRYYWNNNIRNFYLIFCTFTKPQRYDIIDYGIYYTAINTYVLTSGYSRNDWEIRRTVQSMYSYVIIYYYIRTCRRVNGVIGNRTVEITTTTAVFHKTVWRKISRSAVYRKPYIVISVASVAVLVVYTGRWIWNLTR